LGGLGILPWGGGVRGGGILLAIKWTTWQCSGNDLHLGLRGFFSRLIISGLELGQVEVWLGGRLFGNEVWAVR
jgi:hypothetical protein